MKFYKFFEDENFKYLMFELLSNEDLFSWLKKNEKLSQKET